MNKICTSLEQSQKLIELGINIHTADMFYPNRVGGIGNYALSIEWKKGLPFLSQEIPAWSLTALLGLIPESIDDNTDNFSQLEMTKKSISYVFSDGMLRIGFLKENLIDTAFEMVVWLKENGKI